MSRSDEDRMREAQETLGRLKTTVTEKQLAALERRFDDISDGVKQLERDWAANPPTREQLDGSGYELRWCELFVAFQKTYTDAVAICTTDGDLAVMAGRVLGDTLDAHAAVLQRIFSWPMALKTSRVAPARPEPRSDLAPAVRSMLLAAAARPDPKPAEDK